MDHDDNEPDAPDRRSVPGARPLDRQQLRFGTYTPPAPYRVFSVIEGDVKSSESQCALEDSLPTVAKPPREA